MQLGRASSLVLASLTTGSPGTPGSYVTGTVCQPGATEGQHWSHPDPVRAHRYTARPAWSEKESEPTVSVELEVGSSSRNGLLPSGGASLQQR